MQAVSLAWQITNLVFIQLIHELRDQLLILCLVNILGDDFASERLGKNYDLAFELLYCTLTVTLDLSCCCFLHLLDLALRLCPLCFTFLTGPLLSMTDNILSLGICLGQLGPVFNQEFVCLSGIGISFVEAFWILS